MPSFDIVSKVDLQEVDNAVNSVKREIEQRFDFKGSDSNIVLTAKDSTILLVTEDSQKLKAMIEMLKTYMTRRNLDSKILKFEEIEKAGGNKLRQKVTIVQGINIDDAKMLVKQIKDNKFKAQASIRGDEVRIDGKKKDDLQDIIAYLRSTKLEFAIQFINFRD